MAPAGSECDSPALRGHQLQPMVLHRNPPPRRAGCSARSPLARAVSVSARKSWKPRSQSAPGPALQPWPRRGCRSCCSPSPGLSPLLPLGKAELGTSLPLGLSHRLLQAQPQDTSGFSSASLEQDSKTTSHCRDALAEYLFNAIVKSKTQYKHKPSVPRSLLHRAKEKSFHSLGAAGRGRPFLRCVTGQSWMWIL